MDNFLKILMTVKDYNMEVYREMNRFGYSAALMYMDLFQTTARLKPLCRYNGDYAELGLTSAMPL